MALATVPKYRRLEKNKVHGNNPVNSYNFTFGKRVYRNPLKIRVTRDQPEIIDHLLLLVHGAGEYRNQKEKEKFESNVRPRVVRRGCEESEVEDPEPSSVDHLLLLCHGVGSACDMRFRSVQEVVDDFRATSLQLLQGHYRNSYDKGIVNRVEIRIGMTSICQMSLEKYGLQKNI
ncbi:hypothetical protein evm_011742 [Chilo suppressalis]|nr:hypothetical protein evm_011742 [Chilo suppressalis]